MNLIGLTTGLTTQFATWLRLFEHWSELTLGPVPGRRRRLAATIIKLTLGGVTPQTKLADKPIVMCSFDRDEDGGLHAAFEPREMPDERRAITTACEMAHRYTGVIAWSRETDLALGEYGPSEIRGCGSGAPFSQDRRMPSPWHANGWRRFRR